MSVDSLNNHNTTQTWPKSRLPNVLVNDAKSRIKLTTALDRAKAFVEDMNDSNDERTKEVRDLVQHLYEALEHNNNTSRSMEKVRRASAMPDPILNVIREEPHFGSMIWCDMDNRISRPTSRKTSVATLNPYFRRMSEAPPEVMIRRMSEIHPATVPEVDEDEVVDMKSVYADLDPVS
jgi:hypothetical protein